MFDFAFQEPDFVGDEVEELIDAGVDRSVSGTRPGDGHSRRCGVPHELDFFGCQAVRLVDQIAYFKL
jgi:hypothetical protein